MLLLKTRHPIPLLLSLLSMLFLVFCACSLIACGDIKAFLEDGLKATIAYDPNGGSGAKCRADENVGGRVSLADSAMFTREGYVLGSWNTAPAGTGRSYEPGATILMGSEDLLLYAVWSIDRTIPHTVRYEANGATFGALPASGSYFWGTPVTISENSGSLRRSAAYAFSGWNTRPDGSGTDYEPGSTITMEGANLVLYAQWTFLSGLVDLGWTTSVPHCPDRRGNDNSSYYLFSGTPITTSEVRYASTQSFSFSLWFNSSDVLTGSYPKIFNQPGSLPGPSPSEFQYFLCLNAGELYAWVWPAGEAQTSNDDFVFVTCPVEADTWYHVAMVYDGALTKMLELYVNGVRVGTKLYDEVDVGPPSTDFQIGSVDNGVFQGMIGDFRVFDRALGPEEVLTLYRE